MTGSRSTRRQQGADGFADLQVTLAAGRHIDLADLQPRAVRRFLHRRRAEPVQPLGEALGEGVRHVLGDHRRRAVGRELLQDRDQRLDAAGRRADRDDLAAGAIVRGGIGVGGARGGDLVAADDELALRARRGLHLVDQVAEGARIARKRLSDAVDGADFERRERRLGARWVSVETMTTGIGRSRMIFSRNSRPFMFGISMSSVMTSGLSSLIACARLQRIAAWPTTSMSGSAFRTAVIMPRMVAESSTTRTRAGAS